MLRGSKYALSSQMSVVASVTPVSSPPITPPTADRLRSVRDDEMICGELIGLAVERVKLLAVAREPHIERAVEFRRVESVQRLPEFQHHVVRDVHDVVDRAQADRFELLRAAIPATGPTLTPLIFRAV